MAITPALVALFNNYVAGLGGLHVARLYTITMAGGGQLRFTDADFDIKGNANSLLVHGFTYASGGVRVDQKDSKTQAHFKIGTDTDSWTLVVMPRPVDLVTGTTFPDLIGNMPFLMAASGGSLDAADFQVDEAYFSAVPRWPIPPAGAVPVGCRTIFAGTVAEVDTTNAVAVLTVNDYRALLTLQMPRHFYQAQCRHRLFDAGCQLAAGAFAINGSVSVGSTKAVIVSQGLARPQGSGTYTLGRIVFNSGANASFQRTIRSWDGAFTLALLNPLPFPVAAGDSFTIYPGCNKLFATCQAFGNDLNFGGQPFIPPPEVQGG